MTQTLQQKRMIRELKSRIAAITEGRAMWHPQITEELAELRAAAARTKNENPVEILRGFYGAMSVIF